MNVVTAIQRAVENFSTRSIAQATSAGTCFRHATKGVAAVEFAFIFPIMLIAYFGMVDVTDLLSAKRRVTLASSTVADLVTQAPGFITDSDLNGFYQAIQPIMDPFPTATVGAQVYAYKVQSGNISLRWTSSSGLSCGAAPATGGFSDLMAEGNDIIMARTCITLAPITGKVIGTDSHTLTKETLLRPRQSQTICKNSVCP
jgi:Flp pilus assembly protein TadG